MRVKSPLAALGFVSGIAAAFVTFSEFPDPVWRFYLVRGFIILAIACMLYEMATWSDKGKWFAIGAIVTLILVFACFSLFGYPSNKLESPGNNISINITSPWKDETVDHDQQVRGRFSGKLPEGTHAWLLVSGDHGLPFRIWQPEAEIPDKDPWEITAQIGAGAGSNESETGNKYELATVLVDDQWHDYFHYYIQTSYEENYWWNFPLPAEFPIRNEIEVIRK